VQEAGDNTSPKAKDIVDTATTNMPEKTNEQSIGTVLQFTLPVIIIDDWYPQIHRMSLQSPQALPVSQCVIFMRGSCLAYR